MNKGGVRDFILGMSQLSRAGFNPEAVCAQAFLETGWLTRLSAPHNYFGMKTPSWWRGDSNTVQTVEFINGEEKVIEDKFCAFATQQDGLRHYARQLIHLYPKAWNTRYDPIQFFPNLLHGKPNKKGIDLRWSTDPNYVTKLISVYDQIGMNKEIQALLAPRKKEYTEAMNGVN